MGIIFIRLETYLQKFCCIVIKAFEPRHVIHLLHPQMYCIKRRQLFPFNLNVSKSMYACTVIDLNIDMQWTKNQQSRTALT